MVPKITIRGFEVKSSREFKKMTIKSTTTMRGRKLHKMTTWIMPIVQDQKYLKVMLKQTRKKQRSTGVSQKVRVICWILFEETLD